MIIQTTYNQFDIKNYNNDCLIIVAPVFYNYRQICLNYFLNLKSLKLDNIVIFCTADRKLFLYFKENNVPAVFFDIENNNFKTRFDWLEVERLLKPVMTLHIIEQIKCDFITSDADLYVFKSPIEYMKKIVYEKDLYSVCISDERYVNLVQKKINFSKNKSLPKTDQEKYGIINAAFGYWKNSAFIAKKFREYIDMIDRFPIKTEAGSAQTILNHIIKKDKLKITTLHPHLFVNGFTLLNNNTIDYKNKSYIIHFNFVSRDPESINNEVSNKIKLIKQHNLWLLK
jgi:hypothetical protein